MEKLFGGIFAGSDSHRSRLQVLRWLLLVRLLILLFDGRQH